MGPTTSRTHSGDAKFKGVLLDWRRTLVVAQTYRAWVQTALAQLHRDATGRFVETVLSRLSAADRSAIESSSIDADRALHRAAY